MCHRFAAALVAALAFVCPAAAQPPEPPARLFLSPSGEPFRTGDGLAAWFSAADADRDGALNLAEFRADAMRFFKRLDADANGSVDGPENSAYEQEIAPEITRMGLRAPGERPEGRGEGPRRKMIAKAGKRPEPRQGAARFSLLNEPQPVRGADFDLNQRVSADEWARAAGRRFKLLDADEDGRLTVATLAMRLPGPR